MIAYLFYKSVWGILVLFVVMPYWINECRNDYKEKAFAQMKMEFKEYMLMVSNSLQAGYSLERALANSEKDLMKLYEKDSVLLKPVHEMNQKVAMNIQVEKVFLQMAEKTGLEEAETLADILSFSKRAGGDYGRHIKGAAIKIEEKLAVEQEIDTLTAEKRLELKIMCAMPLFILLYISLTSSGFLDALYLSVVGRIFMTICLLLYGVIVMLGKRIVKISV